jgi:anti-sigma B factor antagonist
MSDISNTHIFAGSLGDVIWLRIDGKGSHLVSPQLSRFIHQCLEDGSTHFVIDLENCPSMDSTFIGTLTSIAAKLFGQPQSRVQILNPNLRNQSLINNLGLNHLLEVDTDNATWQTERQLISRFLNQTLSPTSTPKDESRSCMIEAHEALCEAAPNNFIKFKDVLEYLRQPSPASVTAH